MIQSKKIVMPDFTSETCDDIREIVEQLKEAMAKLLIQYTQLNHQLLGNPPSARYVPVITFIRNEMMKTLGTIQEKDIEHVDVFNTRDATRRGDDRWECRKYNEELGEGRINEHLENIFSGGQRCNTMLLVIQRNVPQENQVIVDSVEMQVDIDRGMWYLCRMQSKAGHERAGIKENLIISALEDLWKEVGTMVTSMAVVGDKMKRNQEMRMNQDH